MSSTAPDTVAASYVDLTVAIVTLQGQVAALQADLRALVRHELALGQQLDANLKLDHHQVELLKAIVRRLDEDD
jgi:hypothetical protein